MSAFSDILASVLERGARLIDRNSSDAAAGPLKALAQDLLSSKGEASGIALASALLDGYAQLDEAGRLDFFNGIGADFEPDPNAVSKVAEAYAAEQNAATLRALFSAVEPRRQELLRRLNMAPGGTARLVAMRRDLLKLLPANPELRRIDMDFRHLLASWFNRGFLVLRPIDWKTPAAVLEKIIAYEAVHEIDSWDELRRRVEPDDRRCMAFFHPSMPDEPLIFVEIALTRDVPGAIADVLNPDREQITAESATTAVFYSISNCQAGLAGVSFGAFLIKQVARDLGAQLPGLDTFVTLSPVPGLRRWLDHQAVVDPDGDAAVAAARLDSDPSHQEDSTGRAKSRLMRLAAEYFLTARRGDGQPPDPVARFHLGNGAELDAICWMGDGTAKGLQQAGGLMVNYRYRLDRIEANHEAYAERGETIASRAVRALLRS